jgi:hypothetical protein
MKLNLRERFELTAILPIQGDILSLRTIKALNDKLFPTDAEKEKYEVKSDGEFVHFNIEKGKEETDLTFTDAEKGLIKGELVKINDKKMLKPLQITLYEKFVEAA